MVLWLCSPGASYVVGHALTVEGDMTIAPEPSRLRVFVLHVQLFAVRVGCWLV